MRDRAEEILRLVDGESLRDKHVGTMSAGQQRRIMIGRALAGTTGDVTMLLLDEPSNALDLAAQQDLREMLRKLLRQGISVILITHHIADILPEMQRVVMMRDGRIVADGPKQELLTADRLSGLFGRAITVYERDGYYHAW
jgi:iron complex transport system ATP-binding protein